MADENVDASDAQSTLDAPTARMLQTFEQKDLSDAQRKLIATLRQSFVNQARLIIGLVAPGPERTVALRKLRESKDAAIIGVIYPA